MQKEQAKIDIGQIKKQTKEFVAKEFDDTTYPLVKKEDIENTIFTVFQYDSVISREGKGYFNFKAIDGKDNLFCFNGSNVLAGQLEDNGLPAKVKLVRKTRDDKLRPFYWLFVEPKK